MLNENDKNKLIAIAGKKLGMNPDDLKNQLDNGKLEGAMANMSKQDAAKLQMFMKDPKKMEQLMSSKQAQDILGRLLKK